MKARPHSRATRAARRVSSSPGGSWWITFWLWLRRKPVWNSLRATRRNTSSRWLNSVFSVRRKRRRAGVLKNRSRIVTVLPRGCAVGATDGAMSRPSTVTCQPSAWSPLLLARLSRDTELIAASASPRKPRVPIASRSSRPRILLVAWRDRASGRSSWSMPLPSSRTRISLVPPCSTSTLIWRAPASSAFSSNSLSTEAGRSTTSPAAIWLASRESSR